MLRSSSKHWWLWKEPVVMWGNWNVRKATSQQVFTSDHLLHGYMLPVFFRYWSTASSTMLCGKSAHVETRGFRITRPYHGLVLDTRALAPCPKRGGLRSGLWSQCQDWWTEVSHCVEARLCHEHDVLAHCLAGRQTRRQHYCESLVAASVLATRFGNTVRLVLLQAQRRWGWYSRVWTLLVRVYRIPIRDTDELRKRLVATSAEFQHSVVERNITFSQKKKFCILQGSAVIFFRCGGKGVTVCFFSEIT